MRVCVCVSRLCCLNTENKRKEIRTIQTGTEQEQDRIRNFLGKKKYTIFMQEEKLNCLMKIICKIY